MNQEKKIAEMTEKEILRQQLELLAETSKDCEPEYLPGITNSILSIFAILAINEDITVKMDGKVIADQISTIHDNDQVNQA